MSFIVAGYLDSRYFDSALPPNMHKKDVIFIPVNDHDGEETGGSHWYVRLGPVAGGCCRNGSEHKTRNLVFEFYQL